MPDFRDQPMKSDNVGVTGYFVYRGTGAQVRRAIDDDLRQDAAAFSTPSQRNASASMVPG